MSLGPSLDAALEVVSRVGLVSRLLRELPEAQRPAILAAVRSALEPYARDGAVELGAACWIVSASR